MAYSDKLCLQWNDFRQNITSSFGDLRSDKEFTDVTLACEDLQIEAHKVVLVASSPFFKELLRKNKNSHPLVYMRSLKSEDLAGMMDFLYYGEAKILQENLDSFLALAEELKLNGLTTETSNIDNEEVMKSSPSNFNKEVKPIKQMQRMHGISNSTPLFAKFDSTIANSNSTSESTHYTKSDSTIAIDASTTVTADTDNLDEKIRSLITKSDVKIPGIGNGYLATCNVCGKEGPFKAMPRHNEANHLTGISHSCDISGATSRSKHCQRHNGPEG